MGVEFWADQIKTTKFWIRSFDGIEGKERIELYQKLKHDLAIYEQGLFLARQEVSA